MDVNTLLLAKYIIPNILIFLFNKKNKHPLSFIFINF